MTDTFTKQELALLKKLSSPAKIQDYLNSLPFNFEEDGDSISSPLATMRKGKAHCLEGALLAAYALWTHGHPPLILHLKATKNDSDHVIALFQNKGAWGALSKTNHAVLRYREPVYTTLRELVMSYFHEYFLDSGIKTLRSYSEPLDLSQFDPEWITSLENLWGVDEELDLIKHHDIATDKTIKLFRKADPIERQAGTMVEYSHVARYPVTTSHPTRMAKGNDSRRKDAKKPKKDKK